MKKILDRVYEPQSTFQKTNSVYMEWYGRGDEKLYKEKSGANQVMVDYIQKNAKETGKNCWRIGDKISYICDFDTLVTNIMSSRWLFLGPNFNVDDNSGEIYQKNLKLVTNIFRHHRKNIF